MDEKQHIHLLQTGNKHAFEALVNAYQDRVYNTCLSFLQNPEDAEDLTQEVFVLIFQSIVTFKGNARLSTWIYRIAVNSCLEFLRKKKRQKRFSLLQALFVRDNGELKLDAAHFYHPGVVLENKERAAILFGAIDRLAVNQKTAFLLHKVEGLSHAEVADIMKLSTASVESLIVRAKQNLRHWLGDYYSKNEH